MLGFVSQRFLTDKGGARREGIALKRAYESGETMATLLDTYGIGDARTLHRVLRELGAKPLVKSWTRGGSMNATMLLYARYRDCAKVAKRLGVTPICVYQRLRRSGWTGLYLGTVQMTRRSEGITT